MQRTNIVTRTKYLTKKLEKYAFFKLVMNSSVLEKLIKMTQLIVATNETESKYLDTLFERGIKNNVKDIRIVNAKEIKEIEPNCVVII